MTEDIIILGAGIAGLAAAYRLGELGRSSIIYEARERAGGLLDNFTVDGFRFDYAVHLSFATEPEVRAVFDRTPYLVHQAESLCWDRNIWLKHPVQTNMYPLMAEEKADLIAGLVNAPTLDVRNYHDWLVHQYGGAIAERWPLPYTKKYWSVPADQLGVDWIGQRMRRADLNEVLVGAMTDQIPNQYYVKEMRYPEQGGYRSFLEPLMRDADVRTGHRAIMVDHGARMITFDNGQNASYSRLISTLPLPLLIDMMGDVPEDVREAAASLFATQIDLVSIGFNRPDVAPALWAYIYDEEILAARMYSPNLKSADNVPVGCSSLQFEIYSSCKRPQCLSSDEMKDNCLMALEKMKLASRDDVVVLDCRRLNYGNVVFDIGMEERRDIVRDWIRSKNIVLAGRFGRWEYLWSNQAMMSGLHAGDSVLAF